MEFPPSPHERLGFSGDPGHVARRRLIIALTVLGWVVQAPLTHAQLRELVVTGGMEADTAGIDFSEFPEHAFLSIRSTVPGLAFDSNMGGIVADRSRPAAELHLLVIKPFTQVLTVQAPGYMQARFRVAGPRAGELRAFTVEPSDPNDDLLPVHIRIDPPSASLFINDSSADPSRPVDLPEGEHRIRIEAPGRRTVDETLFISPDRTLFNYSLELLEQTVVRFRTRPSGATLYLDNIREGETPLDNFYYPGNYLVRLTLDGHRELEQQITVLDNQENRFDFSLERFTSMLQLAILPSDAIVKIDGRPIGDRRTLEVRPGLVRLEVERDGYHPHIEQFIAEAGEDLKRTVDLRPRVGTLQFRVLPVHATAWMTDSEKRMVREWTGTDILRDVPVGAYRVNAYAEGLPTQSAAILIQEDQTSRLFIDLTQPEAAPSSGGPPPANPNADRSAMTARAFTPDPSPSPARETNPGSPNPPPSVSVTTSAAPAADAPMRFADQLPEPVGGLQSVYSSVRYPRKAASMGIEGIVFVEFTVNVHGEVVDPVVLRGIGGGCDEEAVRVLIETPFKPAVHEGAVVPARMSLPFKFQLSR